MKINVSFIGIDPGLVHTGVVGISLSGTEHDKDDNYITVRYKIVEGITDSQGVRHVNTNAVAAIVGRSRENVFIEAYKPRANYGTDQRMVTAVHDLKKALPKAKVIDNTGSKQVVTSAVMNEFEVRKFPIASNHQDLQAAARIAIYGAAKDPELNKGIYRFLKSSWYTLEDWKLDKGEW